MAGASADDPTERRRPYNVVLPRRLEPLTPKESCWTSIEDNSRVVQQSQAQASQNHFGQVSASPEVLKAPPSPKSLPVTKPKPVLNIPKALPKEDNVQVIILKMPKAAIVGLDSPAARFTSQKVRPVTPEVSYNKPGADAPPASVPGSTIQAAGASRRSPHKQTKHGMKKSDAKRQSHLDDGSKSKSHITHAKCLLQILTLYR